MDIVYIVYPKCENRITKRIGKMKWVFFLAKTGAGAREKDTLPQVRLARVSYKPNFTELMCNAAG